MKAFDGNLIEVTVLDALVVESRARSRDSKRGST